MLPGMWIAIGALHILYFDEENRVMRKMENTLKGLTLSEMGEHFQEDAPIFFSPTYCVEFCPCAKACFLKSEPILTEAVPAPVNSVRPSFVPHSPLYVCIWLGISPEEVGSWFSVGSHARIRGDCRSLVPRCSEDLYGAGKVQEKGGRSDVSEQELRRLSQRVGDSVSLCSLLIRCLFWSWEHKNSSVASIYSFHLGRSAEGERGYKLCVFLGNFKKYI